MPDPGVYSGSSGALVQLGKRGVCSLSCSLRVMILIRLFQDEQHMLLVSQQQHQQKRPCVSKYFWTMHLSPHIWFVSSRNIYFLLQKVHLLFSLPYEVRCFPHLSLQCIAFSLAYVLYHFVSGSASSRIFSTIHLINYTITTREITFFFFSSSVCPISSRV